MNEKFTILATFNRSTTNSGDFADNKLASVQTALVFEPSDISKSIDILVNWDDNTKVDEMLMLTPAEPSSDAKEMNLVTMQQY